MNEARLREGLEWLIDQVAVLAHEQGKAGAPEHKVDVEGFIAAFVELYPADSPALDPVREAALELIAAFKCEPITDINGHVILFPDKFRFAIDVQGAQLTPEQESALRNMETALASPKGEAEPVIYGMAVPPSSADRLRTALGAAEAGREGDDEQAFDLLAADKCECGKPVNNLIKLKLHLGCGVWDANVLAKMCYGCAEAIKRNLAGKSVVALLKGEAVPAEPPNPNPVVEAGPVREALDSDRTCCPSCGFLGAISKDKVRAALQGVQPRPKPKWDEYPHTVEKCREYMDFLAIEGITGDKDGIGGMALCIAKYLDELLELRKGVQAPGPRPMKLTAKFTRYNKSPNHGTLEVFLETGHGGGMVHREQGCPSETGEEVAFRVNAFEEPGQLPSREGA